MIISVDTEKAVITISTNYDFKTKILAYLEETFKKSIILPTQNLKFKVFL